MESPPGLEPQQQQPEQQQQQAEPVETVQTAPIQIDRVQATTRPIRSEDASDDLFTFEVAPRRCATTSGGGREALRDLRAVFDRASVRAAVPPDVG